MREKFNKKALEKLQYQNNFSEHIKTAYPGGWFVVLAIVILLLGFIVWSFFGTVSVDVDTQIVRVGSKAYGCLDEDLIYNVNEGDEVVVGSTRFKVSNISDLPISEKELCEILHQDYLADYLMNEKWEYLITIEGDEMEELKDRIPTFAVIVVDRIHPIELVLDQFHL